MALMDVVRTRDVIDAITRERARLLACIDGLGDRATTLTVTAEGWTAKDVLAHLIHYAGQVAFGLGAELQPPEYVLRVQGRPEGEEWNALAVAHYSKQSFDAVRAEFDRCVTALVEQASTRTDEAMNARAPIAWAGDVLLWQFIAGDTYLHWALHATAIEEAAQKQRA